jgi:hypothetical protein
MPHFPYPIKADNFRNAILHSGMELTTAHCLSVVDSAGKLKAATVHNLLEVLAVIELLSSSLDEEVALVVFEGLSPMFLAEKVLLHQ